MSRLVWIDDAIGYRCPTCALFVALPKSDPAPTCPRCKDEGEPPQTAMMLTQQEWDDLAEVCGHFRYVTSWVDRETATRNDPYPDHTAAMRRQRELCTRIMEANE